MKPCFQSHQLTTRLILLGYLLFLLGLTAFQASAVQRYFAHEAVEDSHGVIAPWYKGLNGQLDYRARIAVEDSYNMLPAWLEVAEELEDLPNRCRDQGFSRAGDKKPNRP
jgi:hypothetical protein